MRDIGKEWTFDIRKEQKINLENKFRAIKKKWMSLVPTYIEYINSSLILNIFIKFVYFSKENNIMFFRTFFISKNKNKRSISHKIFSCFIFC